MSKEKIPNQPIQPQPYSDIEEEKKEKVIIDFLARKAAEDEFLEEPRERHYEEVRQKWELVKTEYPELADKLADAAIKTAELRDKAGEEAWAVTLEASKELESRFEKLVAKDLVTPFMERFEDMFERENQGEDVTDEEFETIMEEFKNETMTKSEEYIGQLIEEVYSDKRVIDAFEGKEEILEEYKEFSLKESVDLISLILEAFLEEK